MVKCSKCGWPCSDREMATSRVCVTCHRRSRRKMTGPLPTRAQFDFLIAACLYWREHDHGPTMRELSDALSLASPAAAFETGKRLRDRGLVSWRAESSRTLVVTATGWAAAIDEVGRRCADA